jgi:hypothetical protein
LASENFKIRNGLTINNKQVIDGSSNGYFNIVSANTLTIPGGVIDQSARNTANSAGIYANTGIVIGQAAFDKANTSASNTTQNIWTATQTFSGNVSAEAIQVRNIVELAKINTTPISANTTIDLANGSVQFWTSNSSSNTTVNIIWSGTTTLNTAVAVGESVSGALLFTNGANTFYPTTYQIDGTAITPRWQANTVPSSGNASSIDIYTFTIIKTAAGSPPTYTMLAGQTQFR